MLPGDDDQLLLAGKQACRLLYTGQPSQAVIDTTTAQFGADPRVVAVVVDRVIVNAHSIETDTQSYPLRTNKTPAAETANSP